MRYFFSDMRTKIDISEVIRESKKWQQVVARTKVPSNFQYLELTKYVFIIYA